VLDTYSYFRANRDAEVWATIARTLARDYDGDPRLILRRHNYDAQTVLEAIRSGEFPQFGGEKIGPVWIRILSEEIHPLDGVDRIPFPVDTQTRKVTKYLLGDDYSDDEIRAFWASFCEEYDVEPLVVDQALWTLGSKWDWGRQYLDSKMGIGERSSSDDRALPQRSDYQTTDEWVDAVAGSLGLDRTEFVELATEISDRTANQHE